MASLANSALLSSDEEDDDYNPLADKTAEPGDRPNASHQRAKRPRRAAAMGGGGDGDSDNEEEFQELPERQEADEEEEEEDYQEDEEQDESTALLNPRKMAKKAKIDAVWQALNSGDTGGPTVGGMGPPSSGTTLAMLCGQNAKPKKKTAASADLLWMAQLGMKPPKPAPAPAGPATEPKTGPSLVTQMWTAQMGMVPRLHAQPKAEKPEASGAADSSGQHLPNSNPSSAGEAGGGVGSGASGSRAKAGSGASGSRAKAWSGASGSRVKASEEARESAAAAIQAAKEAASTGSSKSYGKVSVTETRRFAGKDIQVTVQVDKNSAEANKAAEGEKVSGLDAFLAELNAKKKVSVLDKSKMDWDQLKSGNAGMEEELENYKKSSNKYLDKVDFLKKAELREYEQERDKRLASDIRTRGRL
eukprot:gene3942-14019_t